MATKATTRKASMARDNTNPTNLGGLAPINTPTRHSYDSQNQIEVREAGVSNPNIYVVQPFKQRSKPKDMIYAKKNAPNPGESLLNSTIELLNHFSRCYEAVKHQLQDEETKEKENQNEFINKTMIVGTRNKTNHKSNQHRPAKQARLKPLIVHQNQNNNQTPFNGNWVGNSSPSETTDDNDLVKIYEEKLRLLRKLKPEFFDREGNLRSRNVTKSHPFNQPSASSFRTSRDTYLTVENDHRTFVTELTKNEENDDENKCLSLISNQQTNSINEMIKDNYILKVIDIKTSTTSSNKSPSEKINRFSRKYTN